MVLLTDDAHKTLIKKIKNILNFFKTLINIYLILIVRGTEDTGKSKKY